MGLLKKKKNEHYSYEEIDKRNATYNLVIGERSNGKTFGFLLKVLQLYLATGKQGAYIRRWADDFKKGRGQTLWSGIISEGKLNGTGYDGIDFRGNAWYLYKKDEELDKKVYDNEPLMYAFALTNMEHDKSTSYPNVDIIGFDEFISRTAPLPDEFVLFMNTVSTIVRHRPNVKIYMMANTVNKYSEYFKEMGLSHVKNQEPGTIDLYEYGESELKVAIEYCSTLETKEAKEASKYFAFDNPKLHMITGGAWEMAIYPHLPVKYKPKDIVFTFFIVWDDQIFQCEIICVEKLNFIYIHEKTTELKDTDKDLIYSPEPDPRVNWHRRLSDGTQRSNKILQYFHLDRVYYQNNEIGESIRNYLQYCKNYSIIKS